MLTAEAVNGKHDALPVVRYGGIVVRISATEMRAKSQDEITAVHVLAVFLIGPHWAFPNSVNVEEAFIDQVLSKYRSRGGPLRDSTEFS
jgi:hypothetical protein